MKYDKAFICDPLIFMIDLKIWNQYKQLDVNDHPIEMYPWFSLVSLLKKNPLLVTSSYRCRAFKTRVASESSKDYYGDGLFLTDQHEPIICFSGWLGIFEYNQHEYDHWYKTNDKYFNVPLLNISKEDFVSIDVQNGLFTFQNETFIRTIVT
jgi:hypothetical protein